MSTMKEKPGGKTPASPDASEAGRLGYDDRGNVTWQWKDDEDLLADDELGNTARVRALVDPKLQVKDDDTDPLNPASHNPKGLKSGYNPYNSGALGKQSWKKKKDLKALSKWIETRNKVAGKKTPDGA
jgi:hypothetical protein